MVPILADFIARLDSPLTGQTKALTLQQLGTASKRSAVISQEGR